MVVRVSAIGPKVRLVKLWIGLDEVLRESVVSKDRALNGTRDKRQTLVPRKCRVVVESVQRVGQSHIVPVGEVVPDALLSGGPQMHGSGLPHSAYDSSHWTGSGSSGDVDTVKHLIQQVRFSASSRSVEGFLQAVV